MKLNYTTPDQITEATTFQGESTDIEFVCDGRLYHLEIGEYEFDDLSYSIRNYFGDCYSTFRKSTLPHNILLEICYDLRLHAVDVTEYTEKGQALLRKQARKNLLSYIVTSANKMRKIVGSMSTALHTAWTKAKILMTGFVQFVKVGDVDTEGEIPVQSRRVASLDKYGIKGTGNNASAMLRFVDLDKIESGIPLINCIISMHVWQVVSWSSL